jgi:ABC-2 type transport system permease protein
MLRDSLFIARKDLQHALRLPQVWVWMFVMPLLLSYIVGSLMQSMSERVGRLAIYAAPDSGFLAADLERRLVSSGYQVVHAADRGALKNYGLSLAIPAGFTQSVLNGPPAEVELSYPAGNTLAGWETYRTGRAVDEMLADLVVLAKQGGQPSAAALAAIAAQPRKLQLRVESAGQARKLILGYQQSVPGFIVMFTLQVALTAGGVLMVAERRQGVLRRLASSPMSLASIVAGKFGARLALGLIQVGVAMLTAKWWFGAFWGGPRLWAVLLLLIVYTALCASLALLFATVARTESQCLAAGVITACVLAALGGCWWPIEVTPTWMQQAAVFLPTGWAMDGLHKLLSYGDQPRSILPHLTGLLSATLLAGWAAVRRFRFE